MKDERKENTANSAASCPPRGRPTPLPGVALKNPRTGETRQIKVGWSWVLFFFSGFFGIPLFLRGLHVWGAVFIAVSFMVFLMQIRAGALGGSQLEVGLTQFLGGASQLGLSIWIALKGNEITAKNYLENGWVFVNPDDEITKSAMAQWGISLPSLSPPAAYSADTTHQVCTYRCQRCGSLQKSDVLACLNCEAENPYRRSGTVHPTAEIHGQQERDVVPPTLFGSEKSFCRQCGERLDETDKFCAHCGARIA